MLGIPVVGSVGQQMGQGVKVLTESTRSVGPQVLT